LNIRYGTVDDRDAVSRLWLLCFPGDALYLRFFLTHIYTPETVLLACRNDEPVGMAHILPRTMRSPGGSVCPIRYVYAVATHPNYRGRGVCSALMTRLFSDMYDNNEPIAVLKPETAALSVFYRRFGFMPVFRQPEYGQADQAMRKADERDIDALFQMYSRAANGVPFIERPHSWWELFLRESAATGCTVLIGDDAYCVIDHTNRVREKIANGCLPKLSAPYACARLIHAEAAQKWAGITPQPVTDPMCPRNHHHNAPVSVEECTEAVLKNGYFNLMHD
jgi:ribosomal protein S18 acetylase RimI-like enzyme